jgi:hypothetical protein
MRDEWQKQAVIRYGEWRNVLFRCPICGHVAGVEEYINAHAPDGAIGFSCIGRFTGAKRKAFGGSGDGPCDYAGGGLFPVNPVHLIDEKDGKHLMEIFDFADRPLCEEQNV